MKKIAIIGAGISGLGAAYILQHQYEITVFEAQPRLGGHARTLTVDYSGEKIAVDTGFIVFNYRNYPHLTKLFEKLNVPVKPSDMSLGLSLNDGAFEWGCQGLNAVFAQRSNIVSPRFWGMIKDIMRFNKSAHIFKNSEISLGEMLNSLKMGADFRNRFLLPTAGAIWSSSPAQILQFPASSFVNFFDNHGLLTVNDQPKWWTVDGGSIEYVNRLSAELKADIRTNASVEAITQGANGTSVKTANSDELFDHVIIAAHSDQALRMLANPTQLQHQALSKMHYQPNRAYLHADSSLMPKRKAAWASWNYLCDSEVDENSHISVTYWLNRLQSISEKTPLFLSLNPPHPPQSDLIFDETIFEHPIYDAPMLQGKKQIKTIQGDGNIYFCGAYHHNGFHEDGLQSAVDVAKLLGVETPW